jgi:hypothetical protein
MGRLNWMPDLEGYMKGISSSPSIIYRRYSAIRRMKLVLQGFVVIAVEVFAKT